MTVRDLWNAFLNLSVGDVVAIVAAVFLGSVLSLLLFALLLWGWM